ncbi:OmpA family protein [Vibrio kagoshimensis]|uniref:OmpA family protein n=1 Tax=Vibrio kagoshimensis TaxID=2910244 RepID=UPI003D215BA1
MFRSKSVLSAVISVVTFATFKAAAVSIPSASVPSGYDRVTTADGVTCESTIASATYVQTGLVGSQTDQKYDKSQNGYYNNIQDKNEVGAYVQMVIPIGEKRERINCNRLYNLEIDRLRAEITKLKVEASLGDIWNEPAIEPTPVAAPQPAPVAPVLPKKKTITFDSQKGVAIFEPGSDRLKHSSLYKFDETLDTLLKYEESSVVIVGHTDSTGSETLNKRLSEKRAESIADYFISRGVNASRVESYGLGETRPIDSNETKEGRQRNRRVEVTIQPFTIEK